MEDEESFIQEFEKPNEETNQMINKYNNSTIYEKNYGRKGRAFIISLKILKTKDLIFILNNHPLRI